jgi:hypothetical protein
LSLIFERIQVNFKNKVLSQQNILFLKARIEKI